VAAAAGLLGLGHVVVTSVTRDDLPDGGAGAFAATVAALRRRLPGATAEILTPDFGGDPRAAAALLEHPPDVFNHNVETVPRLYARVRPGASYRRSLDLLARMAARGLRVKSGLMVGLGETDDEVGEVLGDLREAGVSLLTLGQYLRPTRASLPVERYVVPGRFDIWRQMGYTIGFTHVASGPLVRSSFRAEEGARRAIGERLPPPGPGPSAGPRIGGGHAPPADGGES
jgi:lipoic acid synthetase